MPSAQTYKVSADGTKEKLPGVVECQLQPGEWVQGIDAGGGGYGNPLTRDPERVLRDVHERWETKERAKAVYGVVLSESGKNQDLKLDIDATAALREKMAGT